MYNFSRSSVLLIKCHSCRKKEKEMSQLRGTDPTASGDAPVVEKNCDIISTVELKCLEDKVTAAEEVSAKSSNIQTINEEAVNPNIAVIAHAATKDAEESKVESSTVIALQRSEETPQSEFVKEEKERTKERDDYRRKLEETETKLTALQASYDKARRNQDSETEDTLQSVEQLRGQLVQTALMYEERNRVAMNQENQINALNNQVASLKEVVSITRDLLQIRNMEVKQLQTEVDNMEKKITEERDRHNVMISKMDAAMRLNADLKKEYETQLSLFQSLREKYGEKITLLSAEKRALEKTAAFTPE
ncbi:GRIP domain-containing protein RUD3-like isoform X3 [Nylanderia fulva]|uniref:GRIP domain-containing protein RUD3-like isoform X3 n=1 Tax=Nylanderia fulva TaxID=613905 RepID=UPI0010FBBE18|nr:GRIP domain-containing protein RUD3-like isoform X3 [Nylanderia fulva]